MNIFILVENLGLNATNRVTLISALRNLGVASNLPHTRNHWRPRLDQEAALICANFPDDDVNANAFIARLAALFGVPAGNISVAITSSTYAARPSHIYTFTYNSTPRLRVTLLGGMTATYQQSAAEAVAYVLANAATWNA
jgi:hypothetical protein